MPDSTQKPEELVIDLEAMFGNSYLRSVFLSTLRALSFNTFGLTRDEIIRTTGKTWYEIEPALRKMLELNMLEVKERQIGTAGTTDTFYVLKENIRVLGLPNY